MQVFFQTFANVWPTHSGSVHVAGFVSHIAAAELPPPSLVSFGNFHTLRRCFTTQEEALKFGKLLKSRYAHGPTAAPRSNKQPELF